MSWVLQLLSSPKAFLFGMKRGGKGGGGGSCAQFTTIKNGNSRFTENNILDKEVLCTLAFFAKIIDNLFV